MPANTADTRAYLKALTESGMPEQQAQVIAFQRPNDEIRKSDIDAVRGEVKAVRREVEAVNTALSKEIEAVNTALSKEIDAVKTVFSQEIDASKAQLGQAIAEGINKVLLAVIGVAAIVIGVILWASPGAGG